MKQTPLSLIGGKVHQIIISQDECAESPRVWDNLGTMVCWHRNYNLGDEQPYEYPSDHRERLARRYDRAAVERADDTARLKDVVESVLEKHIIELPLYLYDHSGITMNTSGFNDRWDSGQVGFIYVTIEDVKKEWGWKRMNKARREKIQSILKAEVETYDQYLRGDTYRFEHKTAELPEDWAYLSLIEMTTANHLLAKYEGQMRLEFEEDHCGGFYGDDPLQNGMREHFESHLIPLLQEAA